MCLFPLPNTNFSGIAYKKGVRSFDCGACPECMRKRANVWALRSVYESKLHSSNIMVTLTYDNFMRDVHGHVVGELPVNPDLKVSKRDVQLFIKRLRKWYSKFSDEKIKYIICAEYGSRTHRAHYHCLLFGVSFPDISYYKKSKRGNILYMSKTLTSLWNHGICTIDSVNVHTAVARYCTKYCAKSRSRDTFMLFSQNLGLPSLLQDFNGRSYFIDGREYTIPRIVWQHYIYDKYCHTFPGMSYKYVNYNHKYDDNLQFDVAFERSRVARRLYRAVRDNDCVYQNYLTYWNQRGIAFEQRTLPVLSRIFLLDEHKYGRYKTAALSCYYKRKHFIPYPAPGSNCVSAYFRYRDGITLHCHDMYRFKALSLAVTPCPNTASDTTVLNYNTLITLFEHSPFESYEQLDIFSK